LYVGLGAGAAQAAAPDDNYQSRIQRSDIPASVGSDSAESPMGRLEARKATIGGNVSPSTRLVLKEAARIQSKKAPTVGGAWTSIGPTNITRFQNGREQGQGQLAAACARSCRIRARKRRTPSTC
jgi:hypothetical protein